MATEKFERLRERRVRATASDVPDRFPDVDDQLLADYPELAEQIRSHSEHLAERMRQEREGGR